MKEDDFFSIEQSEELIASLKNGKQSEFAHLQSSLKELAHVDDLPKGATPPVLPSSIKEVLYKMPVEFSKRRTAVVSLIAASLVASATLTAAAVTNSGPAPLVRVAHQTAKFVKEIAGTVTKAVTGKAKDLNETPTPTAPATSATPATPAAPATSATPAAPAATPTSPAPVVVAPTKPAKKESEKQKSPESSKGNDESKSPSTGLTPPPVTGGGDDSDDHETTSDDSFDDSFDDEGDDAPGSSHDSEDDDSEEEEDD